MTYVVLAAGASARMGFAKVFTPLGSGGTPLERIACLLRGRNAIAVVPPDRVGEARGLAPEMRVVANAQPERGMAHSLALALETMPESEDFAVLLGDKPFVRAGTLAALERELDGADAVYPVSVEGVPGHPALFSAKLRERALALPDGDAISRLRDDSALRVSPVACDDAGAFADLDVPTDWEAADA